MAKHPSWTQRFLSEADFDAITRAIKAAESRTSAEIRVHLERRGPRRPPLGRPPDVGARAHPIFPPPGLHRAARRPRGFVFFSLEERRPPRVGERGSHRRGGGPPRGRV